MEQANDSVATDARPTVEGQGEAVPATNDAQSEPTPDYVTKDALKEIIAEAITPFSNDIASLKRSAKKATKASDAPPSNETELLQEVERLTLTQAGITKDTEVELARKLQEETGKKIGDLLNTNYFKSELEALRTDEANAEATADVKGDKTGGGNAKQSAQYWIAKGDYPSREQVPDASVRREIREALTQKEKNAGGKFYNES